MDERSGRRIGRQHARPLIENVSEATAACLIAMVQGNLLALSLSHWLIASQTGILAGVATTAAMIAARIQRPWVISVTLGIATTIVDFYVHPGMFGPIFAEAAVTGLAAGLLSWGVHALLARNRSGAAS